MWDGKRLLNYWDGNPVASYMFDYMCFYLDMVLQSCVLFFISRFCVVAAFGDFPGDKLFIWSTHGIQMRADGLCSLLVWLIGVPVPSV